LFGVNRSPRLAGRWWLWGAIVVVACAAGVAAFPVLVGRTAPPLLLAASAEGAVRKARQAHAARWAPRLLGMAEAELRAARIEARRQDVRVVSFRDYRAARQRFRSAEEAARKAARWAERARADARSAALEAVQRAQRAVDLTEDLTGSLRIGAQKGWLRASRRHLIEAQLLFEAERFDTAEDRAEQAVHEARHVRERLSSLAARYAAPEQRRRWREWKEQTIAWSKRRGTAAIVVNKDQNLLTLYVGGRPVRSYEADLGKNHFQRKLHAGDEATPEGRYTITAKKDRGHSRYYRALELNYPNNEDRRRFEQARRSGQIPRGARPGGLIEIHGDGGRGWDWTRGCVALANADMDHLFARVGVGTPVTIIGSDGGNGRFSTLAQDLEQDEVEDVASGTR
jgi:lipoprotein-anchoring transpeptidase ErfK/SrfK